MNNYIKIFEQVEILEKLEKDFDIIIDKISNESKQIVEDFKNFERKFNSLTSTNEIKKILSKARKKIKKNYDKKNDAIKLVEKSKKLIKNEIIWRKQGKKIFLDEFKKLEIISQDNFGLRKQEKLNKEQAIFVAKCRADHKDISLNF